MKQRYTITIADMEINVISDESPETVESLVGIVDRKMREILTASRRCSKSEAALLCALDYCSDKLQSMRKVKQQESLLDLKNSELQSLKKENDKLRIEIETLRESLLAAQTHKQESALSEETTEEQTEPEQLTIISVDEEKNDTPAPAQEEAPIAPEVPAEPEKEVPETVEPEDVEFDPTEIFRRVKANRSIRKNGKRK